MNFCAFLPFHLLFCHLFKLILFFKVMFNFTWFFVLKPWLTCMLSSSPSSCLSFSLLSCVFLTLFPISSPDLLNFLTPLLFCSFTHSSFPAIFLPFAFIIPLLVFPSLYSLLVFLSPSFFILLLPFLLNCSFLTSLFVIPFLILCFFISPCLSSPTPTYFHLLFLSSFVPYHPPSSLPSSCLFFNFFILYPLF